MNDNPYSQPYTAAEYARAEGLPPPPVPGWGGMAFFGHPQPAYSPDRFAPTARFGTTFAVGVVVFGVAIAVIGVAYAHLSSSRESALREAQARVSKLSAERDTAQATLSATAKRLGEFESTTAASCQAQVKALGEIKATLTGGAGK